MIKKALSMKEISEMAGVSVATVSRVINQSGRYSEKTRERVRAVIDATNYVPNMVAKGLRMNRMENIGIIVPDITNEFFVKLVREVEKALFSRSYASFICNTNESPEVEQKHLRMLRMQNVSGLIYISGANTETPFNELDGMPTAFIDRAPSYARGHNQFVIIESDNVMGGQLATSRLLEHGCKNVLMLTDKRRLSSHQARIDGYLAAHSAAKVVFSPTNIIDLDEVSFESAHAAIVELIAQGKKFDGVFATTDWLAMGAYTALTEAGIRVPEDVRLIGYDDISVAKYNAKPITTVHQQVDIIGKTAVDALIHIIEKKAHSERSVKVPVYLVERQSG